MIIFQLLTLLVSLLIAGEAAALAVGTHIIKRSDSPWVSLKNDLLLTFDLVVGLVLILLVYDRFNFPQPVWFPFFVTLGLLTHLFRIWEYMVSRRTPFLSSRPLFIINVIKFAGLFILLLMGFRL